MAQSLGSLLHLEGNPTQWLRGRLAGKTVLVVGAGSRDLPLPLPKPSWASIAADGATSYCLERGFVPDLIVTDLDGCIEDEVEANANGSAVLVHAHGDNEPALTTWVPRFHGKVLGSVAAAPRGNLVNYGGFTDGDRAIFLAEEMRAREVILSRFNLEDGIARSTGRHRQKLAVALHLIETVAERGQLPIRRVTAEGVVPWEVRSP